MQDRTGGSTGKLEDVLRALDDTGKVGAADDPACCMLHDVSDEGKRRRKDNVGSWCLREGRF